MKIEKQKIKIIIALFIGSVVLVGIFSVGTYVGYSHRPEIEKILSIAHKESQVETTADFDSFWKVWNVLNEKSIYAKKVSDQDRVWGAVSGLASSLELPTEEVATVALFGLTPLLLLELLI